MRCRVISGSVLPPLLMLDYRTSLDGTASSTGSDAATGSDGQGDLKSFQDCLFRSPRCPAVTNMTDIAAPAPHLIFQGHVRCRAKAGNNRIDLLDNDGFAVDGVLKVDGVFINPCQTHQWDHFNTKPVQTADPVGPHVTLQTLTAAISDMGEPHVAAFPGQQFGYAQAGPVAPPVGNQYPGAGFSFSGNDIVRLNDSFVRGAKNLGTPGQGTGSDNYLIR